MMKRMLQQGIAPLAGAIALLATGSVFAASCCGGGSSSALILPKVNQKMFAATFDIERYNGAWRDNGDWVADPDDYSLSQYRLNLGYARRLARNWQASASLPLVYNSNHYENINSNVTGLGDASVAFLYEAFENITCTYRVRTIADLKPSIYLGMGLTIPTGVSPYDNVSDNFDITGRGFYRHDTTILVEKTIFPWNASVQYTYGRHLQRPVNSEYGRYVEPYDKQLGDKKSTSVSFGRTWRTKNFDSWTGTLAYADMSEAKTRIDGNEDPTSGHRKRSLTATAAWSSASNDWIVKLSLSHSPRSDNWGKNFPTTDILSIGISHVL